MSFDAGSIAAKLSLDKTDFVNALRQAKADGGKFAGSAFTAKLGADATNASATIDDIRAKLDKLAASKPSPKVEVQVADAQAKVAQIQARMDRLGAIIARPAVTPQMEKAQAQIDALTAELDRLNGLTVTPEVQAKIDAAQAKLDDVKARLDALQARDTQVRVRAQADLLSAFADLDRLELKLQEMGSTTTTVKVNADTSQAQGALSRLFSGGLTSPGAIGGILLGGGSLLPALPGALTGAAAAAGTLGAAFAGVGKALSAYQAQSNAATRSTASMASAQASAANQIRTAQQAVSAAETQQAHDAITSAEAIKNAQQGVAQAQTQAAHDAITSAESIRNAQQGVSQATQQAAQSEIAAEQQLASAQYGEQQAQQSLTQARQQAILTLQQLTNAAADASLNVQQDRLNLQQAQVTQQQVDANSKSTALQRAQAALAVKQAEQALKEAIQNRTNSAKAAQTADKQGVNGNPAVVAAQHNLAQAHQAVQNAQRNLTQVEVQGAQAIAHAQQSLADAIRSASWQRIADAANVGKAQQGLSDTTRNASWQQQADATRVSQAQAGLKAAYGAAGRAAQGSSATGTRAAQVLAKAMAALSPAGREIVRMLEGMLGEWKKLQGIAQTAVLPGVVTFLKGVKSIMPEVNTEVRKMGGIMSSAFGAIGKTLQSSGFQKELAQLFKEGNQFIKIVGPALGGMVSAFIKMGAQSGPAVTGLAKGLAAIAGGIGHLFTGLAPFSKAAGSILQTLGQAVGALGSPLATVLGTLMQVLAPLLKAALPILVTLLNQISRAVTIAGPGLVTVAKAIGAMGPVLSPVVSLLAAYYAGTKLWAAGTGLVTLGMKAWTLAIKGWEVATKVATAAQFLFDSAMAVSPIGVVVIAIAALAAGIYYAYTHFKTFRDIVHDVWGALQTAFDWVKSHWPLILEILTGPFGLAVGMIIKYHQDIFNAIQSAWNDITSFFSGFWSGLTSAFSTALSGIESALSGAWDTVTGTLKTAWGAITSFFSGWWSTLRGDFTTAVSKVESVLSGAWTTVKGDVKTAWDKITSYFSGWWSDLRGAWTTATSKVEGILSGAWNSVLGTAKTIFGKVKSFFSGFWGDLHKGFDIAVSKVKTAWNKIESVMQTPIKWVITNVYDKLIVRFWNDIAGPVGLPKLHTLAAGGVIPGYAPGRDTVPALLSPGEGVLVPEAVRALGPQTIHAINAQYGRGRGGTSGAFAGGGIAGEGHPSTPSSAGGGPGSWISDIGGVVSGVWDNLGGALKHEIGSLEHDLRAGLALPMKAIGKLIGAAASHVPGTSGIAEAARKMPVTLWDKATSWVIGHTAPAGGGSGGTGQYTGHYGSGVAQWRPDVLRVLAMLNEPKSLAGQVLYQMQTESGGNPNAINLTDCVTLDYVILTKRGWLPHDEVQPGDETIGYNPETGRSEWTQITRVVRYEDAEVWRIGNKHWHADVTPNHRWWSDTLVAVQPAHETCPECGWMPRGGKMPARGVQVHRAKIHGIKTVRAAADILRGEFVRTDGLHAGHRLRVAAAADTDGIPSLSLEDVRIIAWLQGDGTISPYTVKPQTCPECGWLPGDYRGRTGDQPANAVAVHRAKKHGLSKEVTQGESAGYDGRIWQSKPEQIVKLRALLATVGHHEAVRDRDVPAHHLPSHVFTLRREFVTDLLKRSQVMETGPEAFVRALSPDQRAAWLDSMIDAEGNRQVHEKGGEFVRISQVNGPVQEAIKLAVYLEGYRPTFSALNAEQRGFKPSGHVGMARPHVVPSMFNPHEVLERQPVWCVTTELGTWTARGGDALPFLTGNSNAAAGDPSRGLLSSSRQS